MFINFAEHNFTQQDMALMLGVSRRTVENRMSKFYYYYYTLIDAPKRAFQYLFTTKYIHAATPRLGIHGTIYFRA